MTLQQAKQLRNGDEVVVSIKNDPRLRIYKIKDIQIIEPNIAVITNQHGKVVECFIDELG
jgi:sortase (surface protein transpeptidase)